MVACLLPLAGAAAGAAVAGRDEKNSYVGVREFGSVNGSQNTRILGGGKPKYAYLNTR